MIIGKEVILALCLSALMLIGLFTVNVLQVSSFEYLSTKEAVARYTLACFDSDENSSGYGGFASKVGGKNYRWFHITREALELLVILDAIDRVNETAVLHFLNASEIRILYNSEGGYYYPNYGTNYIYNALLSLNALNRLYLAESLINLSVLHYMLVNQSAHHSSPLWANVFVADFLGWLDELNKTWYAESLHYWVMRDIMSNYGCSSSLGYGFGYFFDICSNLMALSMVGGVEAFTSDMIIITDFEHLVRTFLLLRWDGYNGGFADDIGGYRSTRTGDPRFVIASVKPSYICLQLAKQIGYNLPGPLSGTEEWVNNAFARLVSRSQTKYGFFKSSLPRLMLYNIPIYPMYVDAWDYSIEDNYYAVSLLNSANQTQILDEGHFRWPPDSTTLLEIYQKEGYLIPLIVAIVIIPALTTVLIKKMKNQITSKENLTSDGLS